MRRSRRRAGSPPLHPAAAVLAAVVLVGCTSGAQTTTSTSPTGTTTASAEPTRTEAEVTDVPPPEEPELDVEVVADGLEHGWDIGFLPDGGVLVTERPGRIA